MKLRNKRTGEIYDGMVSDLLLEFNTLQELAKEYEDCDDIDENIYKLNIISKINLKDYFKIIKFIKKHFALLAVNINLYRHYRYFYIKPLGLQKDEISLLEKYLCELGILYLIVESKEEEL